MALYSAHEAELVPTVCACSKLLQLWIEFKEASALLVRECRLCAGVPFVPLELERGVALGSGGVILENDAIVWGGENETMVEENGRSAIIMEGNEDMKWNEYEMIHDFALQCYSASKEAIHRLSTDRLAESANLTLRDVLSTGHNEEGKKEDAVEQVSPGSDLTPDGKMVSQSGSSNFTNAEIGRCYKDQPRSSCWESSRLYCPDYSWADDCITLCQRLLRNLSKHKFVSTVGGAHGWNRYVSSCSDQSLHILYPPTYASNTPHPFPSLEAVHALKYIVSDLLSTSLPSHLNQFRAAVEANAVVTKRLYLVKCEYRAPIRAHMESWMALKAAPKLELVERYLKEFHGIDTGGGSSSSSHSQSSNNKSNATRRKNSNNSSTEPSALHKQRDSLEKLIADQWKHPSFLEALQLERLCERLEMEMSQILLPLSHVAAEIMDQSKGRIRAVAVVVNHSEESDVEDDSDEESGEWNMEEVLGWKDVPRMKELLKVRPFLCQSTTIGPTLVSNVCLQCLKTILCRKPGPDESSGIRPLLLDLQGVPRRNDDLVDLSIEVPFYEPLPAERSTFLNVLKRDSTPTNKWYYLDQFIEQVEVLLKLISQPNMPFLIGDDPGSRRWRELIQSTEVWDSDLFRAQYQDWFDMVIRQRELNTATDGSSLSHISETIRGAEIELSIAMASASQLELVRQRLEALAADKNARYLVLAQIVNDVALRELDENIVVLPTTDDMSSDFPKLSASGLFGKQLSMSTEALPIG